MSNEKERQSSARQRTAQRQRSAHPWATDKRASLCFAILCLAAPGLMLLAVLAWCGIYPFGDASFLSWDLRFQYFDFYRWFRRVMTGQASIFYTNTLSLGNNAWGIYSYYLGSPLNLLILFFDEGHITDFVILTDAIKLGLIQLSMAWYLRRRFSLPRPHAFALALCLTWCSWTCTDLCNPLWLDGLYLLPLGMLGVWEYLNGGKGEGGKLVAAVALSVVCCWYMAYMSCLFLALYTVMELAALWESATEGAAGPRDSARLPIRDCVRRLLGVIGRLVLGVVLSAWTFLPTVLSFASGSDGVKPGRFLACSIGGLVSSFFPGTLAVYELPQLFSGTLVLVLGLLFLLDGRIRRRTRLAALVVMLLIFASVGATWAEYVWCGFRMPNGFYSRTAVFVTLGLIWMSGWELSLVCRDGAPRCRLLASALVVAAAALFPLVRHYYRAGWWVLVALGGTTLSALLVSLSSPAHDKGDGSPAPAARIPFSAHQGRPLPRRLPGYGVIALCALELALSAHDALPQMYGVDIYAQSAHAAYEEDATEGFERLRRLDGGAWRMDKTYTRTYLAALDEGLGLGYAGISSYCSSNNSAAVQLLNALGYSNPGEFSVRYASPIPASDSLLGVKYVWTPQVAPYGLEDTGLSSAVNGARAYKNPLALPLGYGASADVLGPLPGVDDAATADANPFEVQNRLASAILGKDVQLFKPATSQLVAQTDTSRTWGVDAPEGVQVYCYVVGSSHDVLLSIDGGAPILEFFRFQHAIMPVGAAGSASDAVAGTHEVSVSAEADADGVQRELSDDASCLFYELDDDALEACIAAISAYGMDVTDFSDGHIAGTYRADDDGLLLLTVPYDKGWTVMVNGERAEAREAFGGAMTAVPVEAGESEVELSYMSPGFLPGCAISLIALGLMMYVACRRAPGRTPGCRKGTR